MFDEKFVLNHKTQNPGKNGKPRIEENINIDFMGS